MRRLLAVLTSVGLLLSMTATAIASPPIGDGGQEAIRNTGDAPWAPLPAKQQKDRQLAQEMVLANAAQGGGYLGNGENRVVRIKGDQFVELAREGEDSILTVLGEFGAGVATHEHEDEEENPIQVTHDGPAGPLHNQIAEPDRTVDNTTIWTPDFSEAYFESLLFAEDSTISMRNFYLQQSSGRYTVNGDVSQWVGVPNNAASYGANYCGDIVCADTWLFVNDAADSFASSFASTDELNAYLAQFDIWDRYDYNGNGNFDEADGYIDHYQAVHAGAGEETGGGAQGEDAIWSHRWYAYFGADGPDGTGPNEFGGVRIGESNYWIGDYTIEPENGGVGVFAHEFGHDLGLPDLYDTSGNVGGAENSTAFWTLMSSGSYGSSGKPRDGIGTQPMHMGNWEKFQLGWLNFDVAVAGVPSTHVLGPAEYNSLDAQGIFILLPDNVVPLELGAPFEGTQYYYSGADNNLDNLMYKEVTLPTEGDLVLDAQVRYQIEVDWDYAYAVISTDGGASWDGLETNLSTDTSPNGQNFGNGITGTTDGAWVPLTADLTAYAGDTVLIGFRYWTDVAAVEPGFQVDAIEIPGQPFDGAEADAGWTFDPAEGGFRVTTGSETQAFFNAYVLENRQYLGFDRSLKTGPYNFGFLNTKPDWVEHFPYQDGLLISYWNNQYGDNNVGDHPGGGLVLPIDAHPDLLHWGDGTLMRPRLQSFDSTFGLDKVPTQGLHLDGVRTRTGNKPAMPVFDDANSYWSNCDDHGCTGEHPGHYQPGWSSVDTPTTGTTVTVSQMLSKYVMEVLINQ